jgi:GTP-binding protein
MTIKSAKFLKGLALSSPNGLTDEILLDPLPKIAFIGRSNVGKSSLINALTGQGVARTSPKPGHTRQINVYLINNSYHLIDLPGYGFASGSIGAREKMGDLIRSYLFNEEFVQKKVVLIVDASVGMTDKDMSMFHDLANFPKDFVVAASKIDKMTQSQYHQSIKELKKIAGAHQVFPFSSTEKTGLNELAAELFS